MELREYKASDVPELIALWVTVFGDKQNYAEKFFAALPDMGSGVVALCGGKIIGAAYTLNGQELVESGQTSQIGYIYGVGVYKEYRHKGFGAALCKSVYALSKKRGAAVVCTLPAEESLYIWYEKILGMKDVLHRERVTLLSEASEAVMPLSATEYALWREKYLAGKCHVHFSSYSMELERQLLTEYGGGFYMTESAICAACRDGGSVTVAELLSADNDAFPRTVASIGALLGAESCLAYLPAETGEKYILSDKPLPADCVWNLSFD